MDPMSKTLRIGLIGPDQSQPCGIADYTSRLAEALGRVCELVFVPFREAQVTVPGASSYQSQAGAALGSCAAILVQYERSLVPDPDFLPALSRRFPGRVFVAPHEVYDEDPFAFPYADIRSAFPPLLWWKRLRYRWEHREYAREKALQKSAYGAHRVLPLSGPGCEILRALAGARILDPVPHAYFVPPEIDPAAAAPGRETFFPGGAKTVLGIFGFLNPGLDYAMILELLAMRGPGTCLLILGGSRGNGTTDLESQAAARGLRGRVRVTGYIPEKDLSAHFRLCDLFLCPMRFKSNSGSLLNLIHLGKPILAVDLPLTRYLKALGAPLELFRNGEELGGKIASFLAGSLPAAPNRYPWTFTEAAEAYLRIMRAEVSS